MTDEKEPPASPAPGDGAPLGSEEETPLPDSTPIWRSLVRVLSNHIACLEEVKQRVTTVRDLMAARQEPPRSGELAELGRAARAEADSATDVARAIEGIEARKRRRARHA